MVPAVREDGGYDRLDVAGMRYMDRAKTEAKHGAGRWTRPTKTLAFAGGESGRRGVVGEGVEHLGVVEDHDPFPWRWPLQQANRGSQTCQKTWSGISATGRGPKTRRVVQFCERVRRFELRCSA